MNWLGNFKQEKLRKCQNVLVANTRIQNKVLQHGFQTGAPLPKAAFLQEEVKEEIQERDL